MPYREAVLDGNTEFLSHFRSELDYNSKMTVEEWEYLQSKISFKTAGRNAVLLEHGKIENAVRFLIGGVIKIINFDVDPYVLDFRTKNDFLCDTRSLLKQHNSIFTFETVIQCEWIQIESVEFMNLIDQNNFLRIAMLTKISDYAQRAHERAALIRNSSAEERYRKFCKSHPEVIKCAKISDIASYLSITPQSLSRIRKNLT